MSHFTVLVVTPEKPTHEVLAKVLQPYHEFECTGENDEYVQDVDVTEETIERGLDWYGLEDRVVGDESEVDKEDVHKYGYAVVKDGKVIKAVNRTSPNKKWDWWVVGGRWSGVLKMKDNAQNEAMRGEPGVFGTCRDKEGFDSAMKGDIDFDGIRAKAEVEARADWKKIRAVIEPHIDGFQSWEKVREEACKGNIDAARKFYNEQPLMKAVEGASLGGFFFKPEKYLVDEEEFAKRARSDALCMFAFLRDGEWAERGEMGWWACVSNEKEDWPKQFADLLDAVPDDHWLTVVDCHI